MAYNVSHIPEGGDYEAKNYQLTMNINRSTDFHISTTHPLLGICCYAMARINSRNLKTLWCKGEPLI